MSERRSIASTLNLLLILIAVSLSLLLLWQLRGLLLLLMISVILASTLAPIINFAQRLKIPRWLAVILVYLSLIAILTVGIIFIGPTVFQQIELLARKLPAYVDMLQSLAEQLVTRLGMTQPEIFNLINQMFDLQTLTAWAFRSSRELVMRSYGVTLDIIGGVLSVLLVLLFSGYMLSGSDRLIKGFVSLFPQPWDSRLAAQVVPVSQKMGGYIQGRIVVSTILAIVITLSLKFLGISEFALGLGVIAGVTNLIPFFGPVLGAIPALIVAIAQGGLTFFWVLLLFVIVQNVETYVLDPLLVGPTIKVPPLYQLLAVLGGAQVLGIIGALIVPPWVAGTSVLLQNLYLKPKLLAEQQAREKNPEEQGKEKVPCPPY